MWTLLTSVDLCKFKICRWIDRYIDYRSTTSHILRRVLEVAKTQNLAATLVFINITKAFESVHRGTLLRAYGIPKYLYFFSYCIVWTLLTSVDLCQFKMLKGNILFIIINNLRCSIFHKKTMRQRDSGTPSFLLY